MIENAIYYPYIHFQDLTWLKAMALFYNRIYRIVPNSIKSQDNDEIKPLLEDGKIGLTIDPTKYSKEAADIFINNAGTYWNAEALRYNPEEEETFTALHSDKADVRVKNMFSEMGYKKVENWMYIPTEMASNYMLFLSYVIANKNNLSLLTDNFIPWTATNYFNYDGQFEDYAKPFEFLKENENPLYFYSLVLSELTPLNISEIPSKTIINFRNKRKDEISNLRDAITNVYNQLIAIENPEIFEDSVKDSLKIFQTAIDNYKRSADILNVKKWFGISVMGFPAPYTLAKFFGLPNLSTSILIATGIAIGTIFSFYQEKEEKKKIIAGNPFSCLALMEKEFKRYTTQRNGGDINWHAYNCLEEYICD